MKICDMIRIALLLLFILPIISVEAFNIGMYSLEQERIEWDNSIELPPVNGNSNKGVAGAFSGFIDDKLIIAGGTNFPDALPWQGGKKAWSDVIYFLDTKDVNSDWTISTQRLPHPIAYGNSIELSDGILCIGGCDSVECFSDVFLIHFENGHISIDTEWPLLPVPLANATASMIDNKIYIAGGQSSMSDAEATMHFFVLDINNLQKGWQKLMPWPGDARGYAVSAVQSDGFDKCFYLFSGRNYGAGGLMRVLTDGYSYNPRLNLWKKLEGNFPVMAGTAFAIGANHIVFLGGVPNLIEGSDRHPGFDNSVRVYHTITGKLITKEVSPFPLAVTTNVVKKGNDFYITSGELKPGIRTPKVLKGSIIPFEKNIGLLNIVVIILYFASLSFIGFYFSKKQKNSNDYFKGGGRLPWWAVGLSIFGTSLSAITFMSIPAKAYSSDWSYMFVNAGIIMAVPIIIYLFIPFYRKLNITTAYEYLELRFNAPIRIICSLAFILFQIGRMGIVLFLPAIALNVVTGFDIFLCIGLMGVLSLIYTMIGGIEAVIWTDALQVVILLGGAILAIIMVVIDTPNGFTGIINEAVLDAKFNLGSLEFNLKQSTLWTVLIATLFTNITTYGTDQTMVQRYMTTETEKQARKSVITNAILTIPATLIFFFVGTVLYVFYKHNPENLSLTISDGDAIFPWYIYSQLPQGLSGLLISGIFAAAMSTLSSSMNSAATAYVVDIHSKLLRGATNLHTAKMATLILGMIGIIFAFMMATWEIKSLWDEFNKILGIILGSMGGLFTLGLVTKRANSIGAFCGILGSVIVQMLVIQYQTVHLLLYTTTGFISCFLIGYFVSFCVPSNCKNVNYLTIKNLFTKK